MKKNLTKQMVGTLMMVLLALSIFACGERLDFTDNFEAGCETAEVIQPVDLAYDKIDILFVVDGEEFLSDSEGTVPSSIDALLAKLEEHGVTDYQLAVLLTHQGRRHRANGESLHDPIVLRNRHDVEAYFSASDNDDAELEAAYAVTKNTGLLKAAGFFRDGAILNINYISTSGSGQTLIDDLPPGITKSIIAKHDDSAPVIYGIVELDGISADSEHYIDLSDGLTINLSLNAVGLTGLAERILTTSGLATSYTITSPIDVDPESIQVYIDTEEEQYNYDPETKTIYFNTIGGPGSIIQIVYCPVAVVDDPPADDPPADDPPADDPPADDPPADDPPADDPPADDPPADDPPADDPPADDPPADDPPADDPPADDPPADDPPATNDQTAPAISAVDTYALTSTSATIHWVTDEASTSRVEYGKTASFGSSTSTDGTLVTSHTMNLSGLTPFSIYYFRVVSSDEFGNTTYSPSYIFRTNR